jgi:hypothetical protein
MMDDITTRWLESVEKRGPRSDIGRYRQGASKLGISVSAYTAYVQAGLKWCSGHARWCRASDFGPHARTATGVNTMCREADRATARERMRRRRASA